MGFIMQQEASKDIAWSDLISQELFIILYSISISNY